jgi:hypothetical protein
LRLIAARSPSCRKQRIVANRETINPDRRRVIGRRKNPAGGARIETAFRDGELLGTSPLLQLAN